MKAVIINILIASIYSVTFFVLPQGVSGGDMVAALCFNIFALLHIFILGLIAFIKPRTRNKMIFSLLGVLIVLSLFYLALKS